MLRGLAVLALHCVAVVVTTRGCHANGDVPHAWQPSLRTLDMSDLVLPYGYPLEEHILYTEDGYLLRLFRIPHGRDGIKPHAARRPVLVAHGVVDSSTSFVVLGPDKSLGFMVADAGYDVWFSNARGSMYSRGHKWLDTNSKEYWQFSYDEMARFDLHAEVEYILDATKHDQLLYVGYSQGCNVGLAALSTQPRLSTKIKAAVMIAPATFLAHITNQAFLRLARTYADELAAVINHDKMCPPAATLIDHTASTLCGPVPRACIYGLSWTNAYSPENLDPHSVETILSQAFATTSCQNVKHWVQPIRLAQPKVFSYFDYGTKCNSPRYPPGHCNQVKYGTYTPPQYDLSAVKTALYFISGSKDSFADPQDTSDLVHALPEGTVRRHVVIESYNHLDFIWAKNIGERSSAVAVDFLNEAARH